MIFFAARWPKCRIHNPSKGPKGIWENLRSRIVRIKWTRAPLVFCRFWAFWSWLACPSDCPHLWSGVLRTVAGRRQRGVERRLLFKPKNINYKYKYKLLFLWTAYWSPPHPCPPSSQGWSRNLFSRSFATTTSPLPWGGAWWSAAVAAAQSARRSPEVWHRTHWCIICVGGKQKSLTPRTIFMARKWWETQRNGFVDSMFLKKIDV